MGPEWANPTLVQPKPAQSTIHPHPLSQLIPSADPPIRHRFISRVWERSCGGGASIEQCFMTASSFVPSAPADTVSFCVRGEAKAAAARKG